MRVKIIKWLMTDRIYNRLAFGTIDTVLYAQKVKSKKCQTVPVLKKAVIERIKSELKSCELDSKFGISPHSNQRD